MARRINLSDFNSTARSPAAGATLEPTDSLRGVAFGHQAMAKASIKALQALPLVRQGKPCAEDAHLGWQRAAYQPDAAETPTIRQRLHNSHHAAINRPRRIPGRGALQ